MERERGREGEKERERERGREREREKNIFYDHPSSKHKFYTSPLLCSSFNMELKQEQKLDWNEALNLRAMLPPPKHSGVFNLIFYIIECHDWQNCGFVCLARQPLEVSISY